MIAPTDVLWAFNRDNPSNDAFTTLMGLLERWHLVKILEIPAPSQTARTAPEAMTPVPSEAGFKRTLAEPQEPKISWVIVVPRRAMTIISFLAVLKPFLMAAATSPALPK